MFVIFIPPKTSLACIASLEKNSLARLQNLLAWGALNTTSFVHWCCNFLTHTGSSVFCHCKKLETYVTASTVTSILMTALCGHVHCHLTHNLRLTLARRTRSQNFTSCQWYFSLPASLKGGFWGIFLAVQPDACNGNIGIWTLIHGFAFRTSTAITVWAIRQRMLKLYLIHLAEFLFL